VDLTRPFLDRGVPPQFNLYDLPFLRWLHLTGKEVDVLSQRELERGVTGDELARLYDLIVFSGHHEYVTTGEYDVIERYRNKGGNLMFLSANNFFWRVEREGDSIVKAGRWRDLGRPEAALVGVQYVANRPAPRAAWVVNPTRARSWLFAGTGLRIGSLFSRGGVEIDKTSRASPRGVQVVADIPNLFGPGLTAQMTYYETRAGARVFAAGAFHLTRAITSDPVVRRILENLWTRLAH
jgi:hypothetical protein